MEDITMKSTHLIHSPLKKRVFEFWKTKPYAPTPQKLCCDVIVELSKCEHYDANPISLFT